LVKNILLTVFIVIWKILLPLNTEALQTSTFGLIPLPKAISKHCWGMSVIYLGADYMMMLIGVIS
jgi:hypothetical protein